MYLCSLTAKDEAKFVGTMTVPVIRDTVVVRLGAAVDASSYLVLTETLDPLLTLCKTVPSGYVSTFAASLRLPVTDAVVHEAIQFLRKCAYPDIADYVDGIVKSDTVQVQAYITACLAVKNKYTKWS